MKPYIEVMGNLQKMVSVVEGSYMLVGVAGSLPIPSDSPPSW